MLIRRTRIVLLPHGLRRPLRLNGLGRLAIAELATIACVAGIARWSTTRTHSNRRRRLVVLGGQGPRQRNSLRASVVSVEVRRVIRPRRLHVLLLKLRGGNMLLVHRHPLIR